MSTDQPYFFDGTLTVNPQLITYSASNSQTQTTLHPPLSSTSSSWSPSSLTSGDLYQDFADTSPANDSNGDASTFIWDVPSRPPESPLSPGDDGAAFLQSGLPYQPVLQLTGPEGNSLTDAPLTSDFELCLSRLRHCFRHLADQQKRQLVESLDQLLQIENGLPRGARPGEALTPDPWPPAGAVDSGPRSQRPPMYHCRKCSTLPHFTSLGTFKRHVMYSHYAKSQYSCFFRRENQCSWTSPRRDKIHEHLRTRHGMSRPLTKREIKDLESMIPPPSTCTLCHNSPHFELWDDFFKCFASHCRIPEASQGDPDIPTNYDHEDGDGDGPGGAGDDSKGSWYLSTGNYGVSPGGGMTGDNSLYQAYIGMGYQLNPGTSLLPSVPGPTPAHLTYPFGSFRVGHWGSLVSRGAIGLFPLGVPWGIRPSHLNAQNPCPNTRLKDNVACGSYVTRLLPLLKALPLGDVDSVPTQTKKDPSQPSIRGKHTLLSEKYHRCDRALASKLASTLKLNLACGSYRCRDITPWLSAFSTSHVTV